ncbi:MAG: hypothetical protein KUL83_01135 [Lentimicrobium sp.]|jgi:hypothetical protein|nr:hypothetical protein [Lentimicrobium sp.]MDD2526998.1 hypothetical protein [Lentimicrobiaceae bacterium]MDD4598779.1 hypothetical protein [Lentimicrobiaceae bacterium]MDY0025012.1 hypothetical protein [Lentimicrobium sp.]HAH57695.1 hypothetical protein [Bacteroidales bacterium]
MKTVNITRENYALFAMDYLDGKLNGAQATAFLLFLGDNPDLKEEFTGLSELSILSDSKTEMPLKQALKQRFDLDALYINQYNYEYYFIAWFEKDLTEAGLHRVTAFIQQHPELEKDFQNIAHSRLLPDDEVIFPAKAMLKHHISLPIWTKIVPITAFAATILLLISIYLRIEPVTEDKLNQTIGGYEMVVPSSPENPVPVTEKPDVSDGIYVVPDVPASDTKPAENIEPVQRDRETPVELEHLPAQRVTINITEPFNSNPRQMYTQLFDDIQLSQELMLADAENIPVSNDNAANLNYGRIMLNQILSSGAQVAEQLPSTLDPWLLADIGLGGFNVLTNNGLKIRRYVDEKGRTQKVQLVDQEKNRKIFSSK